MITVDELRRGMPLSGKRADLHADALNAAMAEFEINNPLREAAFLAQVAHESGQLLYTHELATGAAYEGRKDLGNTQAGDGPLFKGRGDLEITGRLNYERYGHLLGYDLLKSPEILEQPLPGARVSACFWREHGLNELADKGNFLLITKRINGGTNGYDKRLAFYERFLKILGSETI